MLYSNSNLDSFTKLPEEEEEGRDEEDPFAVTHSSLKFRKGWCVRGSG